MTRQLSKDLLLIAKHIGIDISYGSDGSFIKEICNGNYIFDVEEAKKTNEALNRIAEVLKN